MKRVARKKPKEHKKIDIMKPIIFENLGSADDPCFGKHYSIKAQECKRCGDADICAIVSQNQIHKAIQAQEKKSPFIDKEEGEFIDKQNEKLSRILTKRAKAKPGEWLSLTKMVPKVMEKFNLTELDQPNILNRLVKAAQSAKLTLNKSLTKYKYEK